MIGTPCTHCGLAVPPALVVQGDGPQFCCAGCSAVYEILHSNGLSQYYQFRDRREAAVRSSGRSYEEFDHPAFAELYVQPAEEGRLRTELYLEGVHCASCVWLVERVPLAAARRRARRARYSAFAGASRVGSGHCLALPGRARPRPARLSRHIPSAASRATRCGKREDRAMLTRIGVAGAIAGNVMLAAAALYSRRVQRDGSPLRRTLPLDVAGALAACGVLPGASLLHRGVGGVADPHAAHGLADRDRHRGGDHPWCDQHGDRTAARSTSTASAS